MYGRPYDKIGETLRTVYSMDRKPLTWRMIDILETIAEASDVDEKHITEAVEIREVSSQTHKNHFNGFRS